MLLSLVTLGLTMAPAIVLPDTLEKVHLAKVYKVGDIDTYKISFSMGKEGGSEFALAAELTNKVTKVRDIGAEVEQKVAKFALTQGGGDSGAPAPGIRLQDFDKFGMPTAVSVQNGDVVYIFGAFPGYLPNADVAIGDSFDIKWAAADKSFKLEGTGKLVEVLTMDGEKVAKIEGKVMGTPEGESPGQVSYTSYVNLETGKLIKAEGKLSLEDQTGKWEVKRLSPPK